jgi:hypothetical protein
LGIAKIQGKVWRYRAGIARLIPPFSFLASGDFQGIELLVKKLPGMNGDERFWTDNMRENGIPGCIV